MSRKNEIERLIEACERSMQGAEPQDEARFAAVSSVVLLAEILREIAALREDLSKDA